MVLQPNSCLNWPDPRQHRFAEELFIILCVWLNSGCQGYGKLSLMDQSSSHPYLCSPDNVLLIPAWGSKASVCHSLSFLAARTIFKRGFAPVFINYFNRQRVFLLVDWFSPSGGTRFPLPAKSSLYEAQRV